MCIYIYINSELVKAAAFRLREVWAKNRRRITQQTPLERLSTRAILGAPSLHGTSSLDSVPFVNTNTACEYIHIYKYKYIICSKAIYYYICSQ